MILFLLGLVSLVISGFTAHALPDMGRLGYSSCQSCHVSPSGGGTLNKYGRTIAAEVLGTWSYEDAGQLAYGLAPLPEFLDIGGDVRILRTEVRTPEIQRARSFLMQADLEVAVHLSKQVTFSGSAGLYGPELPVDPFKEYEPEFRRYYMLLKPQPWLTLRSGKFFPAYGLMIADHTANIRKTFWPQGSESENIEVGVFTEFGEIISTIITPDPTRGRFRAAYTSRLVGYLGKYTSIGVSGYTNNDNVQAAGAHLVLGIKKKYWLLAELDAVTQDQTMDNHIWVSGSWEMYRSFITSARWFYTGGRSEPVNGYELGLQWFPFPHYEVSLDTRSSNNTLSYVLIGHYYF
jgi:hypothetical protein